MSVTEAKKQTNKQTSLLADPCQQFNLKENKVMCCRCRCLINFCANIRSNSMYASVSLKCVRQKWEKRNKKLWETLTKKKLNEKAIITRYEMVTRYHQGVENSQETEKFLIFWSNEIFIGEDFFSPLWHCNTTLWMYQSR